MIKISIIVPIYNVGTGLRLTVNSLLKQQADYEIILIDDGSQDDSAFICDEYAKLNEIVHVIHKQNGGVSSARNIGIDIATGEYLMFVDAGDSIVPGMLKLLEKEILDKKEPDVISYSFAYCYTDVTIPGKEIDTTSIITGRDAIKLFFEKKFYAGSAWQSIYKKDSINGLRFHTELFMGEDQVFILEVLNKCNRVVVLPCNMYKYIINNDYGQNKPCTEAAVLNSITANMMIYKMFVGSEFEEMAQTRILRVACFNLLNAGLLKKLVLVYKNGHERFNKLK